MKWKCFFEIVLDSRKLGCIYTGSWDAIINLLFYIIIILLLSQKLIPFITKPSKHLSQKLLYFITKPPHLWLSNFSQIAQNIANYS